VITLEFNKLKSRLDKKHIFVTIDEAASNFLVDKGYVPEMGARPLRRVIEQFLEDPLSEKLLQNPNQEKKYLITTKEDKIVFIDEEPSAVTQAEDELAKQ